MTTSHSGARYSRPLIVLHWFTLLLLVGVYGFIEARELFEKGTDVRELMKAMAGCCSVPPASRCRFTGWSYRP